MALLYAHPAKCALEACEGSIGHPRAPDAHICRNGPMLPPSLLGLMPYIMNTVETHASLSYPTGAATCAENCPPAPPPPPGPPRSTRQAHRTEEHLHTSSHDSKDNTTHAQACTHRMPWGRRMRSLADGPEHARNTAGAVEPVEGGEWGGLGQGHEREGLVVCEAKKRE